MTRGVGFDKFWDDGGAVTPDVSAKSLVDWIETFDIRQTGEYWAPRGAGYEERFPNSFLLSSLTFHIATLVLQSLPSGPRTSYPHLCSFRGRSDGKVILRLMTAIACSSIREDESQLPSRCKIHEPKPFDVDQQSAAFSITSLHFLWVLAFPLGKQLKHKIDNTNNWLVNAFAATYCEENHNTSAN